MISDGKSRHKKTAAETIVRRRRVLESFLESSRGKPLVLESFRRVLESF